MTLRQENQEYVLVKLFFEINESIATFEQIVQYKKYNDDAFKVTCIMVETRAYELQRLYEDYRPYTISLDLDEKFHKKARKERYEVIKSLLACQLKEGESVCTHAQRMQIYMEWLEKLNLSFDNELVINMVLNSLPPSFYQFILNYYSNNTQTTLTQLHNVLQITKSRMKKYYVPFATSAHVYPLVIIKEIRRRPPPNLIGRVRPMLEHLAVSRKRSPTLMLLFLVI